MENRPEFVGKIDAKALERFALAENDEEREKIVSQMVPGSLEHALFYALLSEQRGFPEDMETRRRQFSKTSKELVETFDLRKEIKQFDPHKPSDEGDNKKVIDKLRELSGVDTSIPAPPNQQAPTQNEAPALPDQCDLSLNALLEEKINSNGFLEWFGEHWEELNHLLESQEAFRLLQAREESCEAFHFLVRKFGLPWFVPTEEKVRIVEAALLRTDKEMFGEAAAIGKIAACMTTKELYVLKDSRCSDVLRHSKQYVECLLDRILPEGASISHSALNCFDEAWLFAKDLPSVYNDVKVALLYGQFKTFLRLHGRIFVEEIPRDSEALKGSQFFKYLELPRAQSGWGQLAQIYRGAPKEYCVRLRPQYTQDYSSSIGRLLPDIQEEKEIVLKGMREILAVLSEDEATVFSELIDKSVLTKIHAEAKLLSGSSDMHWVTLYGSANAKKLSEERKLEFAPHNKEYFGTLDNVVVHMLVKNVPVIAVSIFEVNTLNYYKRNRREITTEIDLEGMVPNKRLKFEFQRSPLVLSEEQLELPPLSKPRRSVFLVEISGGGKTARAIIRKGFLRSFYRHTVAGTALSVLDESFKRISVENLVVHCMGRTFHGKSCNATEQGEILIPPPPTTRNNEVVIVDFLSSDREPSFAALFHVDLPSESYELETSWFFERESTTSSCSSLPLLIRPRLYQVYMNDRFPVPLSLLEEFRIIATWHVSEGGTSREELTDFQLDDQRDINTLLNVPVNAISLDLEISGYVRPIQGRERKHVLSTKSANIPGISKELAFKSLYLKFYEQECHLGAKKIPPGYRLYCLGKNGEPYSRKIDILPKIQNDSLNLLTEAIRVETNDYGFVSLGLLPGICSIVASPIDDSFPRSTLDLVEGTSSLYGGKLYRAFTSDDIQANVPFPGPPGLNEEKRQLENLQYTLTKVANVNDHVDFSSTDELSALPPLEHLNSCVDCIPGERLLTVSGLPEGYYKLAIVGYDHRSTCPYSVFLLVAPEAICAGDCSAAPASELETRSAFFSGIHTSSETNAPCCLQLTKVSTTGSSFDDGLVEMELLSERKSNCATRVHLCATVFEPKVPYYGNLALLGSDDSDILHGGCGESEKYSSYASSTRMDEEERYINRRQNAQTLSMGPSVSLPSLLVNPTLVKEMHAMNTKASRNDHFGEKSTSVGRDMSYSRVSKRGKGSNQPKAFPDLSNSENTYDFLPEGAVFAFDLTPTVIASDGKLSKRKINIPVKELLSTENDVKSLSILVTQGNSSVSCCLPLTWDPLGFEKSLSSLCSVDLKQPFNSDSHYIRHRKAALLPPETDLKATYMSDSKLTEFTCLKDAYRLLDAVSPANQMEFGDFRFLPNWPSLSSSQKLEYYSRYACSEFHLFLWRKDREFYEAVVKPLISCKRSSTLIDQYLLGHDLMHYQEVYLWNTLNALEKCLVIDWVRNNVGIESAQSLSKGMSDYVSSRPTPEETWNTIFEHAFASSKALEETVECQEENVVHAMFSYGGGNESSDSDFDSAQPPPCSGSIAPGMLNVMETCALPQARSEVSAAGAFKKRAAPKRAAPKRAAGIFGGASRARFSGSNHIRAMEAEMDEEEESGEEGSMDDISDLQESNLLSMRNKHDEHFYEPVESTKEYAESQYYRVSPGSSSTQTATVDLNEFWSDFAKHCSEEHMSDGFASANFPLSSRNINELLLTLALLDLPFERPSYRLHVSESEGMLKFSAPSSSYSVVFYQEIMTVDAEEGSKGIVCRQRYFNPLNKKRKHKSTGIPSGLDTSNCVTGTVYGCEVVITNISRQAKTVDALLQIPQGAIPVEDGFVTKVFQRSVASFSTVTLAYKFYFPATGDFTHYPVQVSQGKELLASADPCRFSVKVQEAPPEDTTSWEYLRTYGEDNTVINFLTEVNLEKDRHFIDDVLWRCTCDDFWNSLLLVLYRRNVFHEKAFSLGFSHYSVDVIKDFVTIMQPHRIMSALAPEFNSSFLLVSSSVENEVGRVANPGSISYQHVEYWPLVRTRVHDSDLPFEQINSQWKTLLMCISYKETEKVTILEKLILVYHLCLQDRMVDAYRMFESVGMPDSSKAQTALQKYITDFPDLKDKYQWKRLINLRGTEPKLDEWFTLFYDYMAAFLELRLQPPAEAFSQAKSIASRYVGGQHGGTDIRTVIFSVFPISSHVATEYQGFPSKHWSEKMDEIHSTLKRLSAHLLGKETVSSTQLVDAQKKEASFNLKVLSDGSLELTSYQRTLITVKYYFIDVETLFSKEPFLFAAVHQNCKFGFVKPNFQTDVQVTEGDLQMLNLPDMCKGENFMVEASSDTGQRRTATHCSNALHGVVDSTTGFVRVEDHEGTKALSAVYVKVYWRAKGTTRTSSNSKFYKDGYTDVLGRFDFASLSTDELDKVEEFAILVAAPEYGAEVFFSGPPSR